MYQVDLPTLIQQALDNGDTATARALSRALENQTRITTVVSEPEPVYTTAIHQSPVYDNTIYRESPKKISITWWLCFVILPYLAIAEVMTPGHQGPLKIHQTDLDWPITLVGNTFKALGGEKSE